MTTVKREKRAMYAVTIPPAVPADRGERRTREKVFAWLRKHKADDPIARATQETLKAKDRDADVIVALSKAKRNTFVERVCLLHPLEGLAASMQLPSFAANAERALLATRLLNCESANRAHLRAGSNFEGFFVALFETGCRSVDEDSRQVLEQLKDEGFRIDSTHRRVADEIKAKALALVPARHSWRPDLKIAFAPPELAINLAGELMQIEQWLAELAAEHDGDEAAFWQSVLEGLKQLPTTAAGSAVSACNAIFDVLARRIKALSVSVGAKGVEYKVEFRRPGNDAGNDCKVTRKLALSDGSTAATTSRLFVGARRVTEVDREPSVEVVEAANGKNK